MLLLSEKNVLLLMVVIWVNVVSCVKSTKYTMIYMLFLFVDVICIYFLYNAIGVEYIKVILQNGRMIGAILIGDTDLEVMTVIMLITKLCMCTCVCPYVCATFRCTNL